MTEKLYHNTQLILESGQIPEGSISWRSPSNLALVKYWGKHGRQLPRNPSISLTLEQAYTDMVLEWSPREHTDKTIELELYFDGERNEAFEERIRKVLEGLTDMLPFLYQLRLVIDTHNSFPHSAGIASSASSMSALALCLCSLEDELFTTLEDDAAFEQKASYIARLASGSAGRSIFGTAALWGTTGQVEGSSDLYAIGMEDKVHPVFRSMQNAILIVSKKEKEVSSSAGHALMSENPYAEARYAQARQRLFPMLEALESGDVPRAGTLIEQEALALHALMMTSTPSYLLMEPASLELIRRIRAFRRDTGVQAYFSLDAGPNIHLLYPEEASEQITDFIITELAPLCQDGKYIADNVGPGPVQL